MKTFPGIALWGIAMGLLLAPWACGKPQQEPESPEPETIPVSSVTIGQQTAEMFIGETVQLTATVLPADASDKKVTWTSSKQSVATVSETGLVTALDEGVSTITAAAGGKSSSCLVTVSRKTVPVSGISLSLPELALTVGEEKILTATVKPDDATDKTVTWSSSNPTVAKVQDGVVSALSAGSATIIAKAGDMSATCSVTVSEKVIAVQSVVLDQTALTLKEGETATLTATVKPDDATDKTVTWSSSNPAVAKVQDGVVSALSAGSATIIAKAGDMSATCSVTVSEKVIAVESVVLDQTALTLKEGETATLTATVKPDDATDKTVTWSSSDPAVASVQNGVVTAYKSGTATITAKAGEQSATCSVTVKEKDAVGGNEDIGYDDWN